MPGATERSSLTLLVALTVDAGTIPKEFCIFKAGMNDSKKGPALFDEEAAKAVMADYAEHGADVPFDWEHAMSDKDSRVADRRAAGWFDLEVRNGELWAVNIRWNDEATEAFQKKHWRYFSPTFFYETDSRRVVSLFNVALCNKPASLKQKALIAASQDVGAKPHEDPTPPPAAEEKPTMTMISLALLASTAGLSPSVSEADALAAVTRHRDEGRTLVALTGTPTVKEALEKVAAWKASHESIAEAKAASERAERDALITEAKSLGQIADSTEGYWRAQPLQSLKSYLEADKSRAEQARDAKRDELLKQGQAKGQITAAQVAYWKAQSVAALEGFLATTGSALPAARAGATGSATLKAWSAMSTEEKHRMLNDDPQGAAALKLASQKG